MGFGALPAEVVRHVVSLAGRDSAVDGSLWAVARGWDAVVADSLDWSELTISRGDRGPRTRDASPLQPYPRRERPAAPRR